MPGVLRAGQTQQGDCLTPSAWSGSELPWGGSPSNSPGPILKWRVCISGRGRGAGLGGEKTRALSYSGSPSVVCGRAVRSFPGFLTFPTALSLAVSLRTGGGRTIKLTTCFHFGSLLHLQRNLFSTRSMPFNTNRQASKPFSFCSNQGHILQPHLWGSRYPESASKSEGKRAGFKKPCFRRIRERKCELVSFSNKVGKQ